MLSDTSTPPATSGRFLSPAGALVVVVALGLAVYAAVAYFVKTPRIFYDELVYMEAAASLAEGDGLEVRGEPYDYGVLYPTLIAPLHLVTTDREGAYALIKLVNALLFALTAIPTYGLARRLLAPWPSVGVAALAILVPSSVYVTVVMTESLAYLTSVCALLAIALAVERPTVVRQVVALAAIGVAIATRPQLLVLYAALLVALAMTYLLLPQRRERRWRGLPELWPMWASLALGLVLFVLVPLVRGSRPQELLGGYDVLLRSYDLATVAKWLVYHASALELYLAVVAIGVAPIVLAAFYRLACEGSERHGAFLGVFASFNAAAVGVAALAVAFFQTTPDFEIDHLHDRYLFYVVPLWLIVLAWWIVAGAPRPRVAARFGIGLALVLALVFPYGRLELENGVKLFSAVGTAFPAAIEELAGSTLAGAIVSFLLVGALLAAVFLRPAKAATISIAALVVVFLVNSLLVWGRAFNPPEGAVFAGQGLERRWVDGRVPGEASVTILESSCEDAVLERDSYLLTEFFNGSIGDVVELVGETPAARVEADGSVVLRSGRALEADYVVAQPGARLDGDELATGTAAGLVLWNVSGAVRVSELAPPESVSDGFCMSRS